MVVLASLKLKIIFAVCNYFTMINTRLIPHAVEKLQRYYID